jgi:hypothetical protein
VDATAFKFVTQFRSIDQVIASNHSLILSSLSSRLSWFCDDFLKVYNITLTLKVSFRAFLK